MLRLLLTPLLVLAVWLVLFTPALASATTVEPFLNTNELQVLGFTQYESVNPNSLLYPLKQISEKISSLMITDQDKKGQFYSDQLDKRFKELVFILNNQKTGFMDETIGRYNSALGFLKANYPTVINKEQTTQKIKILEALRDRYHSGTGHWVNIQQTVDTTESLL